MHMGIFLFKAPCCHVFLVLSLDMEELNSEEFIVHKKRANDFPRIDCCFARKMLQR